MTPRASWSRLLLMAVVACAATAPEDDAARLAQARAQFRRGAYDSAATAFGDLAARGDHEYDAMPGRRVLGHDPAGCE